MKHINIINGNLGNVNSLSRFLTHLNLEHDFVSPEFDTEKIKNNILIIPGNGNWDSVTEMLSCRKEFLLNALDNNLHIIGICAGFQSFFKDSEEGNNKGLGVLKSSVKKINSQRLPIVGNVKCSDDHEYYFLNSFGVSDINIKNSIQSSYKINNKNYMAYLFHSNFFGFQFHPEISGKSGISIFKKALDIINQKK
jgi:glutamine amidotransferase